jgi:hypothetical protein
MIVIIYRQRHSSVIGADLAGSFVVPVNRRPLSVLFGRSLALCAHPYAAWRSSSTRGRLGMLIAYTTASYVVMLVGLFLLFM